MGRAKQDRCLVMQNDIQQRTVYLHPAVVFLESQRAESVHEKHECVPSVMKTSLHPRLSSREVCCPCSGHPLRRVVPTALRSLSL